MSDPIVKLRTAREEVDDALYEAAVIATIVRALAGANISGAEEVCGTMFDWLAKSLTERIELVQENVGRLGRT